MVSIGDCIQVNLYALGFRIQFIDNASPCNATMYQIAYMADYMADYDNKFGNTNFRSKLEYSSSLCKVFVITGNVGTNFYLQFCPQIRMVGLHNVT